MKLLLSLVLSGILVCCGTTSASAKTVALTPEDNWFEVLSGSSLKPGDEVALQPGTYSDPRRLVIRHSGAPGKPITIRAAGQGVVFRRPNARQNTFNLEGCQYLQLIGFEITGGAAAIRIQQRNGRQPSDVLLDRLHIHHIGGVAVTCNQTGSEYRRMNFRGLHIHHTAGHGEGFYLGGNDASAIFADSLVENNYIHHLNGDAVSQGDGIEIKHGSFGNLITGNIIHDTNYPGITVYGTLGKSRNVIQGNLIWNTGDHGIQAAADSIIRKNFIANTKGCGIYSREHQSARPGNLRIENNKVIADGDPAIRIIGSIANSDQGQRRASPIELIGNQLIAGQGLAIRIDNSAIITAGGNAGEGTVVGSESALSDWNANEATRARLPKLKGHPGWPHLDRSRVEQRFQAK